MRITASIAVAVGLSLASSFAFGVRTPTYLSGETGWVAADGHALRVERSLRWRQPAARTAAAWKRFTATRGGTWHGYWDLDTGVPQRLFGSGIAAAGAVANPAVAERATTALLIQEIDLLAPGSAPSDFVLVADQLTGHLRSVGFAQQHLGMPVLGGHVSFRIEGGRIVVLASSAWPDVDAPAVSAPIGDAFARSSAASWVEADFAAAPTAGAVDGPLVLPLVAANGAIEYHTVLRVRVDLASPVGSWDVYVDAASGAPVARHQRLMFGSATMLYNAPDRWWGGTRSDYPAFSATLQVEGADTDADDMGVFSWSGTGSAAVVARARGPLARAFNKASGGDASWTGNATSATTLVWDDRDTEYVDAQISGYVHALIAKRWARTISDVSFLDDQIAVNVNINDTCNAYSDGNSINFYRAGGGCGNTARIADVVYHEFGHSLHGAAIIDGVGDFDGALSEGLGDFVAASITGDPAMGIGFFETEEPLRHCDPPGMEYVWPDDVGEIHDTGRIYCGAMYDLRKNLIAELGATDGVTLTNELFYESFRRATDIPSTYVELLAWDDDDGDLSNGTPHRCAIDGAYARHGLADPDADTGPKIDFPVTDGLGVTLPVVQSVACPAGNISDATLEWQLRADPTVHGTVTMDAVSDGFTGDLPAPPWGSVVQYKVTASADNGDGLSFPTNRADPWYETFVGDVTVLYCTDFESDPAGDGWTHELVSGTAGEGADDWMWDTPYGQNGDPHAAYSGDYVYGNDLGPDGWNGQYQNDKFNRTTMPEIDTQGFGVVRLQYRRWLNVEDGTYDQARITAGGMTLWSNLVADGSTHHLDNEWRFHDVDLTPAIQDGKVQVAFELQSDAGAAYGGWTLDDLCIVAYDLPTCGDGVVEGGEACDDGNTVDGDGCQADCTITPESTCGDGVVDTGEECDDGNTIDGDGCSAACVDEGNGADEGGGCGCRSSGGAGGWLLGLVAVLAIRRRRRRS